MLYGVRFNGSKLRVYKYKIINDTRGVLDIEIDSPGMDKLATHQNDRIVRSMIGQVHEQYNAYIVYIESIDAVGSALGALFDKVLSDKNTYLEAVKIRTNEFDAQLKALTTADINALKSVVAE